MKPPRDRYPTEAEVALLLVDNDLRASLRTDLLSHSIFLDAEQLRMVVALAEHLADVPSGTSSLDAVWILLDAARYDRARMGNGRADREPERGSGG